MPPVPDERFTAVFRSQYARLVFLARRVLDDMSEAEDAAQDALIRLRNDPVLDRSEDDIAAWLSRVVTNGCLNRLRTRRRAEVRAEVVASRESRFFVDAVDEEILSSDERDRARVCLALLPERQATVLLLRYAGHSYREIAAAVGVAEGSVGVLLARGERAFRRAHEEMSR